MGTTGLSDGRSCSASNRSFDHLPLWKIATILLVIAFFIRLAFLAAWFLHSQHWEWGFAELGNVAANLYAGRGFSSPLSPNGSQPTAWFAPVVPYIWALILGLTGGPNSAAAHLVLYCQVVPSSIACVLYWAITRHVVPASDGISPLAVFAVQCVWPESLIGLTDPWYFVWQECAVAVLFFSSIRGIERFSYSRSMQLGAAAATCALINPVPLPMYPFALAVMLWRWRQQWRQTALPAATSVIVCVLLLAPWAIRNVLVLGYFIPLRSNFGIELRQGNNPQGSIRQTSTSVHPAISAEERRRFDAMGEVAYSSWAQHQALAYMLKHPRETAHRVAYRTLVYWLTEWLTLRRTHWGTLSHRQLLIATVRVFSALVPLVIVIAALALGHLKHLRYKNLFAGLFFFLPLPYYVAHTADVYSQAVRPWLCLLAVIGVVNAVRQRVRHTSAHGYCHVREE